GTGRGPPGLVLGLDGELVRRAVLGPERLAAGLGVVHHDLAVLCAVLERRDAEALHGVAVVLGGRPGPAHVEEPVAGTAVGRAAGDGGLPGWAGGRAVTGRGRAGRAPPQGVLGGEREADVGAVLEPVPGALGDGGAELAAGAARGVGEDQL